MLRNDLNIGVIAIVRSAAPDCYEKIADGWKMSAQERKLLLAIRDYACYDNRFVDKMHIQELYMNTFDNDLDETFGETVLAAGNRLNELEAFYALYDKIPDRMPIDGNDVINLGIKGAEIGKVLDVMWDIYFARGFRPEREEMLQTLAQYVIQRMANR